MKAPSNLSRILITLAVIVVVLFGAVRGFMFLSSLRAEPEQSELAVPLVKVAWQRARKSDHRERVLGTGRASSMRRSVVTAEVTGIIKTKSPKLEAGSAVKANEVLLQLDARDYQLALKQSEARLQRNALEAARLKQLNTNLSARLKLMASERETASRELDRLRRLARSDAASLSAIEAQESAVAVLERARLGLVAQTDDNAVRLQQAAADRLDLEAALERTNRDVARCFIRSPLDGEIELCEVDLGERVTPGAVLFQVVDTRDMEVAIRLPASRFGEVKVGSSVEMRGEVEGHSWSSKVSRVGGVVSQTSHTFNAYVVLDNQKQTQPLADGLFVEAFIAGRFHEGVFAIPRTAFVGDHFFILKPDAEGGTAQVVSCNPVIVRALADLVLVKSGVEEGAMLALTNVDRLANGGRVLVGDERGTSR